MRNTSAPSFISSKSPLRPSFFFRALMPALAALSLLPGCQPPPQQAGGNTGGNTVAGGNAAPTGTASGTGDIAIGEYGGLTGETAGFGKTTHNGIQLALEEVNAAGGFNGRQLRLFTEDNESKQEKVPAVVTKLITQNKVVAVLGEVASSRSIAAAPICERYQIPMISPSSTNTAVTVATGGKVRDYAFRVCFIDPFQGEAMAKFIRNNLKLDRVAVFRNVKEDYSKGLADAFTATFTKLGGTITTDRSYATGDRDFRAQLTAIKGTNPQAIFVPGYYKEVGLMAQQAKDIGLTVPLAGGDGWDDPSISGLPAMEGHYFTNHYSVNATDPRSQAFVSAYTKRYNETPNALSALGYDAAMLLVDAMKRSKSLNGPDLKEAIAATKGFAGVTGNITLNEQHNAVKPAVVIQFKGGKHVVVDSVQP